MFRSSMELSYLKKGEEDFSAKENFDEKLCISTNTWQIVQFHTKAVLNKFSEIFYRLVICDIFYVSFD